MSRSKIHTQKFSIDEVSGIKVLDIKHQIWTEGYKTEREDKQVIKSVFKWQNGMVMVFDKKGEQIPKYQGQYEDVKENILKDAPPDAVFSHDFGDSFELNIVPREEW